MGKKNKDNNSSIIHEQMVLIQQLEEEIFWMKSSKFWKLRQLYIRTKSKVMFAFFHPRKFVKKYIKSIKLFFSDKKGNNLEIDDLYLGEKEKFDKKLKEGESPKVLAIVNHYYNYDKNAEFPGKSSRQEESIRKKIIEKTINSLKDIPNTDVIVCGINGFSLVGIDKDFSSIEKPVFLVYESIEWMFTQIEKYDYFINIEDDILLTKETFERIVDFDGVNAIGECFHPNRMEYDHGMEYCADFKARSGWRPLTKKYKDFDLRVAQNPHSGVTILSKPKMLYARDMLDLKRRDIIIGHYMASAYANVNSPFLLYRSFPNLSRHKVIHLDNWEER